MRTRYIHRKSPRRWQRNPSNLRKLLLCCCGLKLSYNVTIILSRHLSGLREKISLRLFVGILWQFVPKFSQSLVKNCLRLLGVPRTQIPPEISTFFDLFSQVRVSTEPCMTIRAKRRGIFYCVRSTFFLGDYVMRFHKWISAYTATVVRSPSSFSPDWIAEWHKVYWIWVGTPARCSFRNQCTLRRVC